jgi:hypothetical protein
MLSVAAVSTFLCREAAGAPKDAAALKLREQAIYTDYLATNFEAAEGKLAQAIALCSAGPDCEPAVRARLECDLAAVYFSDQKPEDARAHFTLSLKHDPNAAIDKDLSSPELQRLLAAVRSSAGAAAPAPSAATQPASEEDLRYVVPPAQAVLTPVPVFVTVPHGVDAVKVTVRFKAFGVEQWKTATLKKMGSGWGGEIPCADVGDSLGDLRYFIQATDENGDLVATSGRLVAPHLVHIVAALDGEPPHLPEQPPPARCTQKTDCPPGFPGCHDEAGKIACVSDDECASQQCTAGFCEEGRGAAVVPDAPFKQNWISVAFQADLLMLPAANDACKGGTGYTCFASSGKYYSDIPLTGADDVVLGGIQPATMRVLLGYDRVLGQNIMVGARLGYAFNGGPQRPTASGFLPVSAEARGSYWFGHDPLGRSGFRFFVLVGGGAEEVDASVPVDTYASLTAYNAKQSQNFQAWKKTGLGFAELGPGAMYAFTPNSGVLLEAKAVLMFPTSGAGAAVQLGYTVGL